MPRKPLRECTYPGCHQLVSSGRCTKHSRIWCQPSDVKRLYNSRRWKELRAAQLIKEPWCGDCVAKGIKTKATEVDHIKPHKGDSALFFDPDNLQSKCKPHHSSKTAGEVWH
jgi:5-methylcytosine-specific restriction enzyme A